MKIVDGKVETSSFRKPNKLSVHWTFTFSERYKRNAINGDLNRFDQISINFDHEKTITEKYRSAGFLTRFIPSAMLRRGI